MRARGGTNFAKFGNFADLRNALTCARGGTVQLATSMATQDDRAIKNILKRKLPDVKRFAAEIEIHRSLDHPNVVKLYEIYEDARCMSSCSLQSR